MPLRGQAGASELTNAAFERAANAFEALVRNSDPVAPERGFRRTIAAASYHLAGFTAVAYSLFNETPDSLNTSPGETAIRHLILRDLDQLRGFVREWLTEQTQGDERIAEALGGEDPDVTKQCRSSSKRLSVALWRISTSRLRRASRSRLKPRSNCSPRQ